MADHKNGVGAKIKEENPKCLYTHCYGHAFNLCVKDACTEVPTRTGTFAITKEICKLLKKSPQRETLLKKLRKERENDAKSVHAFCSTRWTVRDDTLKVLINNHNELMGVWENGIPTTTDTDMKTRMIGVQTTMRKLLFLFGCLVGAKMLSQTDILSKTLQSPELCPTEAHKCADGVMKTLKKERCEEEFNLSWRKVEEKKMHFRGRRVRTAKKAEPSKTHDRLLWLNCSKEQLSIGMENAASVRFVITVNELIFRFNIDILFL